ncbi:MAG TPA: response regulator [Steroidobacteraceae bacterium]|nr:response regulator [Steroidobacteraceae bacterium]
MDDSLPDIDAPQVLAMVRERSPHTRVIFLDKCDLEWLPDAIERAVADSRGRGDRRADRIWRLSRDLFAVLDKRGMFGAANPSWWRVLGLREEQLLGTSMRDLVHDQDAATFDAMLQALQHDHPIDHVEMRMRRRDGVCRWIFWTAVPQADEVYAVGRDITDVKQAAVDLEQATATLRSEVQERLRVEATLQHLQRVEAIGQVTAGVAHDFNNLLAVVLGNTVLLERMAGMRERAPEMLHLAQIRRAVEGGRRVARQLLGFSRPQSIEPQALDLNQAVASIRDLLKSSLGGAIQFKTELQDPLWTVLADRTQLEMALLNLVINARDAMPQGGVITVHTRNVIFEVDSAPSGKAPGDYVSLSVEDTGSGMSDEVRARAFEPFYSTKEPGLGSGLGLAQVADFARRSGGSVQIATLPDRGTTVEVHLPRATKRATAELLATSDDAIATSEPRTGSILVVDDDPAARAVAVSILRDGGHRVWEADGGPSALEILKARAIDVLLIDFAMPGMNGAETASRALQLHPNLGVLFLTGYADIAGLQHIGVGRMIEKPCSDEQLLQAVGALLCH